MSGRTVRTDIARLRELGYPVHGVRGGAGHYRLGAGAKLPPLLLADDEAVAVAIGLRAATGVGGLEESSTRALAKLEQVLPNRLKRQVAAVHEATDQGPRNTDTADPDPVVDPEVLTALATAIRDREHVRFDYRDDDWPLLVEPYRLVSWQGRWYLVGRTDTWQTFRVDWLTLRMRTGRRFEPVALPGGDYTAFVLRDVASTGWAVHARITVHAPAATVLARINPAVGLVEQLDAETSVLVTGADSVETIAVYVGLLNLDFEVTEPAALVAQVRLLAERYGRALPCDRIGG